jgi:hypothetical protein
VNLRPQTLRGIQDIREYNKRHDEKYRNKRKNEMDLLRKCIPGREKLTYPQILKNAANYIQQLLNPDFMAQGQERIPRGYNIKEHREYIRKKSQDYRNVMKEGYNLLRKWVPGTSMLSRVEILKRTVKYIQELEQRSPVKKREELETSQKDRDSAEALMPQEMAVSIPKPVSSEEEKLLRSPEEFLVSPEEEMELLASPEELPDFNNMEDFIQWIEL